MELLSYVLITNVIYYGQTRPAFAVEKNSFYLGILFYKSSVGIYLP